MRPSAKQSALVILIILGLFLQTNQKILCKCKIKEKSYYEKFKDVVKENKACLVIDAVVGVAGSYLGSIAGFGSNGVIANSYASAWQSSIGNIPFGSLFSTLQKLAMKKLIFGLSGLQVIGATVTIVVIGGVACHYIKKYNGEGEDEVKVVEVPPVEEGYELCDCKEKDAEFHFKL